MEVFQDKIKGDWSYKFEYEDTVYTEEKFKSKLDAKSVGVFKEMQVIMGQEFIPESPESKEKPLFEKPNNQLLEKPITKSNDSIEKEPEKKQTLEKVSPKVTGKVSSKDTPETSNSQSFEEDNSLKSITQSNKESITQAEDDLISNDGWIPLFRKSMGSQVFQNEGLWKVWTWCMMKASHTEQWVPIKTGRGKTEVHILPGQFIFGRKTAAKELKMKPPTIQKRMLKLKNMQNCITQSHKHYSLVTLTNWEFYRELQKKGIGKVSGKYQASITYKKNKKEKNIYIDTSKTILTYLNQVGNRNFTTIKANLEPIQARLKDGHTEEECKKVIDIKWTDSDFNKKFFRPTTLFQPTKFEGYLNEKQQEQYDGF